MDLAQRDIDHWRTLIEENLRRAAAVSPRSLFLEMNPHLADDNRFERRWTRERKDAAVLVPIVNRPSGASVLLTVRSSDMSSHAGQISFPGGKVDDEDVDRVATALREAEEEVNIPPSAVRVIGELDVHLGGLGFSVTPVVGIVDAEAPIRPNPREVAEIFEMPLAWCADMSNHTIEERQLDGVAYRMSAAPFGRYHVWGLTAGILRSLAEVLRTEGDGREKD